MRTTHLFCGSVQFRVFEYMRSGGAEVLANRVEMTGGQQPRLSLVTIKVLNLGSLNTKNKIEGGKGSSMWLLATRASGSGEIGGGNRSQ